MFSEKKVDSRHALKKAEYLSSPPETTNYNARFLNLRSRATRKIPSENVVPPVDLNHFSSALCAPLKATGLALQIYNLAERGCIRL